MNLLDRLEVLRVLFYPRREDGLTSHAPGVHPVTMEVEPGVALGGRLYPAGTQDPIIVHYHGNGEIAADYDGLAPLYTHLGITLLVLDYRGYGRSGGAPMAKHLLADAVTAFDALDNLLERHGLSPGQRYVMGRSLGSAAAIEVASRVGERLAGLIVESGFADTFALLARLGLQVLGADEDHDGFGNPSKISHVTTRTLIIHGQADVLIPVSDGRELYRCSAAPDKQLIVIPGAGHNDLMLVGLTQYFEALQRFVLGEE